MVRCHGAHGVRAGDVFRWIRAARRCFLLIHDKNVLRRKRKKMNIIEAIEQDYKRTDIPEFGVGDTLKVYIKIKEGNRERVQLFEGFVLKIQNGGLSQTFTVRRIASGVGVEKTFPMHSPMIEKIEVVRKGSVRRAKLNYMRERTGKAAKIKTKEA
jgi:large subunit ribosomal protein L19